SDPAAIQRSAASLLDADTRRVPRISVSVLDLRSPRQADREWRPPQPPGPRPQQSATAPVRNGLALSRTRRLSSCAVEAAPDVRRRGGAASAAINLSPQRAAYELAGGRSR